MKLFEKIFKKRFQRKKYFYIRHKNGLTFTFYSDVPLTLSDEILQGIVDTISSANAKRFLGNYLAEKIFEQLHCSNKEISSLEYSCNDNGNDWVIAVSTHPHAFQD